MMRQSFESRGRCMYDFASKFSAGLEYEQFLSRHGTQQHRQRWQAVLDRVRLSDEQQKLLGGFVREMRVLCLAGAWCGDCVNQCPIFERFAKGTSTLQMRYLDRDVHADLQQTLSI